MEEDLLLISFTEEIKLVESNGDDIDVVIIVLDEFNIILGKTYDNLRSCQEEQEEVLFNYLHNF